MSKAQAGKPVKKSVALSGTEAGNSSILYCWQCR